MWALAVCMLIWHFQSSSQHRCNPFHSEASPLLYKSVIRIHFLFGSSRIGDKLSPASLPKHANRSLKVTLSKPINYIFNNSYNLNSQEYKIVNKTRVLRVWILQQKFKTVAFSHSSWFISNFKTILRLQNDVYNILHGFDVLQPCAHMSTKWADLNLTM